MLMPSHWWAKVIALIIFVKVLYEYNAYGYHSLKFLLALAWHPFHEEYFVSGSFDGSIYH